MSSSKSKELNRAKELIDKSEYDKAEQLIKNFEEKRGHTLHDIVSCHLLKCELLLWRGLHEDVIKLAEEAYKESLELGKNILSVDILLIMAYTLLRLFQTDRAHDITKQGEELLKTLTLDSPVVYKQREAFIAFLKGWVYEQKSKADPAIKQFELSMSLWKELDVKHEIAMSLIGLAHVFMYGKGDKDLAFKYLQQGLAFAEESGNKNVIGYCFLYMAKWNLLKGELDRSIMFFEQSLTISKKLNNKFMIIRILISLGNNYAMRGELDHSIRFYEQCLELSKEYNSKLFMANSFDCLADIYRMKGELERALESIEQSMALNRELGALRNLAYNQSTLIEILIEKGDLKSAQQNLHDLEQLNLQLKDRVVNFTYLFSKVILLKTSPRARNRVKAEKLLRQILEVEDLGIGFLTISLLNLCELLLIELQITNDPEILEEIKPLTSQLLDLSDKAHSFWILGETYLLQAKLALISLNLEEARKLLTQGQKIAEKYGLTLLARKISHEHDELLKRLDMWENLKDSKTNLTERMELARLNEQMKNMIQKRVIEKPEPQNEESVLLLIVSEGGRPLFSEAFVEEWSFDDDLFGGFLSAINSFSDEMFSEGLNRANFGEYTIIMNSFHPFLLCYLFKGQSYLALQRVTKFIENIKKDSNIWKIFNEYNQACRFLQLKDIPYLEPLITKIFRDKSFPIIA